MMSDNYKTSWISRGKDKVLGTEKPWGFERSWTGFNEIHGKILFIKSKFKTSLKYHKLKSETLHLISGKVMVTFGSENTLINEGSSPYKKEEMNPGDTLLVQSGCPYRIEAIVDSQIVEIGNNLPDKPIRIEDDYGRNFYK